MMWILEYVRRSGTLLLLNFMFGITMFLVFAIENTALRCAIIYLIAAAMFVLDFFIVRSMGEQDFKMSVIGAAKRKNKPSGIPEGKSVYHISKEYRIYKGFLIALITVALAILLIVIAQGSESAGTRLALLVLYGWIAMPVLTVSASANLYFCLIVAGISVAYFGIVYIIGGEKGRLQHYVLLKKTNAIVDLEKQ